MRHRIWALVLGAACLSAHPAPADERPAAAATQPPPAGAAEAPTKVTTVEGITEYRLPNGLRVLLYPDRSKPVVTVNVTVLVGSRHEGYGETGMAHLLEHMLFKGTPTRGNIKKLLGDRGANPWQATTGYDRTNYYETLPASDDNLAFALRLEADRMANSCLRREDLISEMTVVRNEFEAKENSPNLILNQRMMAAAFEWHNYGKRTIGNRADIERMPIDALRAFYKKHYRPDNMVLTVAGQFDETTALGYVARYFGPLRKPAHKLDPTYTQEPPQDGERQVALRRVGTGGAVGLVYHVPAASHPDFAAVDVLARCLGREPGGRVYTALVESKKSTSVSAGAWEMHDPGVLVVAADAAAGGLDATRAALIDAVEGLDRAPITDREVADALRGYAAGVEQFQADSNGFAVSLSEWIAAGDWRLFFVHRDRKLRVTAADVNRVARQYLVRSNRTTGVYDPTAKPERAPVPDAPPVEEVVRGYRGRTAVAAVEAFDPTPANLERHVTRGTLGPIKTALLPRKTRGDLVTVQLTLRYGNEESLTGTDTAAQFVPAMLLRGTRSHTRQQLTDEVNRLGAGVSTSGGTGSLTVVARAKRADLPATLRLVGEILREPAFPAAEFDRLKAETVQGLTAAAAEPMPRAVTALLRKVKGFPAGNIRHVPTPEGAIERYQGVTLEQVRAVYEKQLGAQAGELAVVGDFDPAVVTAELGRALAGWTSAVPYRRVETAVTPVGSGETIRIETPDKANAVYAAALAVPLAGTDPDYIALALGVDVLGGGESSRLWLRVREKDGLSYGVGASVSGSPTDRAAVFEIEAIANPANLARVDAAIAEEVDRLLADGVTDQELAAARKANREAVKVARSDDDHVVSLLAGQLARGWTFQREIDEERRIEALTPADVRAALRKYVDPKKLVIVHAGDLKKK